MSGSCYLRDCGDPRCPVCSVPVRFAQQIAEQREPVKPKKGNK